MSDLGAALWVEMMKIRRSKTIWIIAAAFGFVPLMIGFLFFILKNPDLAHSLGLIAAKTQLLGSADWPSLFLILKEVVSIGGIFGFGFLASWIFGREYADRTAKDLLALPVSRAMILFAKFIAVAIWSLLLSALIYVAGLLAGSIVGLSGFDIKAAIQAFAQFGMTAVLTVVLSTPIAYLASCGRGYMLPLGFLVLVVLLTQFVNALGYAAYFPWAIPAIYCGAMGDASLGIASYIILLATGVAGVCLTLHYWCRVDQT